jgi:hypothetical protein
MSPAARAGAAGKQLARCQALVQLGCRVSNTPVLLGGMLSDAIGIAGAVKPAQHALCWLPFFVFYEMKK